MQDYIEISELSQNGGRQWADGQNNGLVESLDSVGEVQGLGAEVDCLLSGDGHVILEGPAGGCKSLCANVRVLRFFSSLFYEKCQCKEFTFDFNN